MDLMRAPQFLPDYIAEQHSSFKKNPLAGPLMKSAEEMYYASEGVRPLDQLESERKTPPHELINGLPAHSPASCINGIRHNCVGCLSYYLKRLVTLRTIA